MSTALGEDASAAYHHFWREAHVLGTISGSFETLATHTTAAYYTALTQPAPAAWTRLIVKADKLVRRARALDGIVELGAKEREALDFFEAIVRENDDLLVLAALGAGAESPAAWSSAS